jgi:hypothetical protein
VTVANFSNETIPNATILVVAEEVSESLVESINSEKGYNRFPNQAADKEKERSPITQALRKETRPFVDR